MVKCTIAHADFIDVHAASEAHEEVIEHVVPIVEITATDSTAGEFNTPLEISNSTPKSTTTITTIVSHYVHKLFFKFTSKLFIGHQLWRN